MYEICLLASWPVTELAALGKRAENAGLERVWCRDCSPDADVFVALTILAQATTRVRLGPAGLDPASRHPIVALGAMLTLDELSGGRAFLAFDRTSELEPEATELARKAASGGRQFSGQHFQLDNATYTWGRRELEVLAEPSDLLTPASPEEAMRLLNP